MTLSARVRVMGLLAVTAIVPLRAQDSPLAAAATALGQATSQSHAMADTMQNAYGKPNAAPQSQAPAMTVPQAVAKLSYQPTPEASRAALDAYVGRLREKNPTAADATAKVFANQNISQIYTGIIAPFGLHDGNLADAYAAYTVLGWMIVNSAADPAPGTVQAARDQLAVGLASSPQLLAQSSPSALGEEVKLLFVTLDAGWLSARREGKTQQYSDGVAAMFAKQGMDMRAMQLTPAGFSRR